MRSYSVAEARDNFLEMLEHVRSGETVAVTENGHLVAEVKPASTKIAEKDAGSNLNLEKVRNLFKDVKLGDLISARHEGHKY